MGPLISLMDKNNIMCRQCAVVGKLLIIQFQQIQSHGGIPVERRVVFEEIPIAAVHRQTILCSRARYYE